MNGKNAEKLLLGVVLFVPMMIICFGSVLTLLIIIYALFPNLGDISKVFRLSFVISPFLSIISLYILLFTKNSKELSNEENSVSNEINDNEIKNLKRYRITGKALFVIIVIMLVWFSIKLIIDW